MASCNDIIKKLVNGDINTRRRLRAGGKRNSAPSSCALFSSRLNFPDQVVRTCVCVMPNFVTWQLNQDWCPTTAGSGNIYDRFRSEGSALVILLDNQSPIRSKLLCFLTW